MKISFLNQQDKHTLTKELRELIRAAADATLRHMEFRRDVEVSVMITHPERPAPEH